MAWLCPSVLRCRKCERCLVKPVLLKGQHVCRGCLPKTDEALRCRKPEQVLLGLLAQWRQFLAQSDGQFDCTICRTFMVSPVSLSCCGHTLCFGCVKQMAHCPLCRKHLPPIGRWSVNSELVALMEQRFDPLRLGELRRQREAETLDRAALEERCQRYLDSDRWLDLHTGLKLACKQAALQSWHIELARLQERLAELVPSAASSPLSGAEFALLLRSSAHIEANYIQIGGLLLRTRHKFADAVLQHQGHCSFAQLGHLVVAAVLDDLLQQEADVELICTFLAHNDVAPHLIEQFRQPVEWYEEGTLAHGERLAEAGKFVHQIAELDLINTRPAPQRVQLEALDEVLIDSEGLSDSEE